MIVEAGGSVSQQLARVGRIIFVLAAAVLAGVAVTIAVALIGHQVLVRIYGDDLAPIERTLPWIVALGTSYLAGAVSALVAGALGWRQLVWR